MTIRFEVDYEGGQVLALTDEPGTLARGAVVAAIRIPEGAKPSAGQKAKEPTWTIEWRTPFVAGRIQHGFKSFAEAADAVKLQHSRDLDEIQQANGDGQ